MIVLASGSPRRRQLLDMIGLEFRVVPPDVDESLGPSEQPEGYVTRLAREKATTVAARERGTVVLGADTTVVLRGAMFGKPASPAEAAEMLRQLEGRKHQVMTAVAVARDGRVEHALDVTDVTFRALRCALPLHPVDRDLLRLSLDLNRVERLDARGPLQLLEERL